eukprot:361135-Chlamydomonas_euryale.AAC.11
MVLCSPHDDRMPPAAGLQGLEISTVAAAAAAAGRKGLLRACRPSVEQVRRSHAATATAAGAPRALSAAPLACCRPSRCCYCMADALGDEGRPQVTGTPPRVSARRTGQQSPSRAQ